jgi:hypothetical protein
VYVDLLILLTDTDPMYVDLVAENVPETFAADADIFAYCKNGYRSYTFHYRGARSVIRLDEQNTVDFFADSALIYEFSSTGHEQDIAKRGRICLAMLDREGNILQVSAPQSLRPKRLFAASTGMFRYDAAADQMTVDSRSNFLMELVFLLISGAGVFLTCSVETFVALFFDSCRKYRRLILLTNLISQVAMRILQILILWLLLLRELSLPNYWFMLLLELPVFICEYLVYRKHMQGVSRKECLLYTVCANTASAVLGLGFLTIIFER